MPKMQMDRQTDGFSVLYSRYRSFEKFTVEYFHLKIVCDKIFLSFRVADKDVLATNYF